MAISLSPSIEGSNRLVFDHPPQSACPLFRQSLVRLSQSMLPPEYLAYLQQKYWPVI